MVIAALLVTMVLERLLFTRLMWVARLFITISLVILVPAITGVLLFQYPHWVGIAVGVLSFGRVFNYLRVAKARMHDEYLFQSTKRTSLVFILCQLPLLVFI